MNQLTEEDIKRETLKFLRGYYKSRPRASDIEVSSDLRGAGGIVADGFLAFKEEDGRNFIITFEATDYHKRDELRYKLLKKLLIWDAVAMAYLTVALLFILAHVEKWLALLPHYFWGGVILLQVLIGFFALIWYYFLRPWRRYRYIYAIEQFNQYFADDQWVAFAHDVFPSYEDRFFKELRRQCVHFGFGMLELGDDGKVKLHIAPSIDDPDFQLKRKVVQLFTKNDFTQFVQKNIAQRDWWEQFRDWLNNLPLRQNLENLWRFERPVYKQMGVILACIGAMTLVLAREFKKKPIRYVDEATYEQQMTAYMRQLYGNDNLIQDIILDSTDIKPFLKNTFPYIYRPGSSLSPEEAKLLKEKIVVFTPTGFVHYPCERLHSTGYKRFMVRMGVFYEVDLLKRAIQRFRKLGVPVNGIWGACFFPKSKHYILFMEDLFTSRAEALEAVKEANTRLNSVGIKLDILVEEI